MRKPFRSIKLTITLGSVTLLLSAALLVGWTLVLVRSAPAQEHGTQDAWLLVAGILSLAVIMTVIVLFSVRLVGEINEGRRQTSFLDSVTHELKSPLASLKLCLETMARQDLSAEQRGPLRAMMLEDVERLNVFINDVLETSRLTHGRVAMRSESVAVLELARRCAARLVSRHGTPPSSVTLEVAPALSIRTDPGALETVVINLLDNALKYSDGPPAVTVSAQRQSDGWVRLEVRDEGIGIPRDELKRVFQRFYRVPDEPVRARRGTGLGLFVVRSLVRKLGGRLEACSDGAGRGATLRVLLPPDRPERKVA